MKKFLLVVGGTLLIMSIGFLFYLNWPVQREIGSVSQSSEYHFTQLTGAIATTSAIGTNTTVLGSVIITEDHVGTFMLYDATSTAAVGNGLTRTIADFQSAEPEGTYTFDVWLKYGLVYVSADGYSFAGDWTITHR